jgi:hypothetical protein
MSGHEGRIRTNERKVYFTLMGACELVRPTFARQILAQRRKAKNPDAVAHQGWHFFLTIMGATEISAPTLAEEFLDLRELIKTGALSPDDWDRGLLEAGQSDQFISSFTLMGGFSETELPGENEEVESLALHRHLGNIPDQAGQVLQLAIGQHDAERRATVRRAFDTAQLA